MFDKLYQQTIENPVPPMTLRVGITGHRPNEQKMPSENLPLIEQKVKWLMNEIWTQLLSLNHSVLARQIYRENSQPVLRLTSALAEGIDRLCLNRELITPPFELACILPFYQLEYEKDFEHPADPVKTQKLISEFRLFLSETKQSHTSNRLIEMEGDRNKPTESYNNCGKAIVEHSDLMLAIYDGQNDKNEGTAAVASMSKMKGVPLIFIDTRNPENCGIFVGNNTEPQALNADNINALLKSLLLFTDVLKEDDVDLRENIKSRIYRYAAESNLTFDSATPSDFDNAGPIMSVSSAFNSFINPFQLLSRLFASPESIRRQTALWTDEGKLMPFGPYQNFSPAPIDFINDKRDCHHLYSNYLRADRLANHYASLHRSIFVSIYLLGAIALILAGLMLAIDDSNSVKLLLLTKTMTLLSIIYLYRKDRRKGYHDRWLEYRALAEILRASPFLSTLAASYSTTRLRTAEGDVIANDKMGPNGPGRVWIYIFTETMTRWVGFSNHRLNHDSVKKTEDLIKSRWLEPQINYHTHNAAKTYLTGTRLAHWSVRFFYATLIIVLAKLVLKVSGVYWLPEPLMPALGMLALILPVLGSLAFALRNHAEFEISSQRSFSMRHRLISNYQSISSGARDVSPETLGQVCSRLSEMTARETADWIDIYEVKVSEPA